MNKLLQFSCLMIAGSTAAFSHPAYGQAGNADPTALAAGRLQLRAKIGSVCSREGLSEHPPHCLDGKLVVCLNQAWTVKDSWEYTKCKSPVSVKREVWALGSGDKPESDQTAVRQKSPVAMTLSHTQQLPLYADQARLYGSRPPIEGSSCSVKDPSPWQTYCYDGRFAVCLNGQWTWKDRWLFLSNWVVNGPVALREDGVVRPESQGYASVNIDSCHHDKVWMDELEFLPRPKIGISTFTPGSVGVTKSKDEPEYVPGPKHGNSTFTPGFVGVTRSRARTKTGISVREMMTA